VLRDYYNSVKVKSKSVDNKTSAYLYHSRLVVEKDRLSISLAEVGNEVHVVFNVIINNYY